MALPGLALPELPPLLRLDTLPPWPWDILDPTAPPTLGWSAIAWGEGWTGYPGLPDGWRGLTQPNGPRAGQPFRFTQRQRTFLCWFYALDADAQWIFDAGVRRLAKGAGKSPFAGEMSLGEFLAPVRLATFRRGAPGGVEARTVDMALVQIAATAESQTANTMRHVRAFAPRKSYVADFYNLDVGKTVYYGLPEKTLEVITSSATAAEGAESSFIVKDELEHWRPTNGGPELSATLDDNLAKSGARSLGTANAWVPGQESVAENEYRAWVLQEEGATIGDTRILYDAVIAPPDTDMADPKSLQEALEFVYADCDWKKPHEIDPATGWLRPVPGSKPDVRPIMRRIYNVASSPDDSQRKYLNRPVAPQAAWIDPAAWALMYDPTRVVADREPIVAFFDGSKSRDATGIVGCTLEDGHVFVIGAWESPTNSSSSQYVVPVHEVDATVARMYRTWDVRAFFGDVHEWESFVKLDWPKLAKELGIEFTIEAAAAEGWPIAWDMRTGSHQARFTKATELCRSEIEGGSFTHDGNPVLARHMANARERENRNGTTIGKESRDSPLKIDLAVCTIGARMVRQLVLVATASKSPPKSKTLNRS
jgi:hypothetical protein